MTEIFNFLSGRSICGHPVYENAQLTQYISISASKHLRIDIGLILVPVQCDQPSNSNPVFAIGHFGRYRFILMILY